MQVVQLPDASERELKPCAAAPVAKEKTVSFFRRFMGWIGRMFG
jgi:hypothetical protein